jgi:hypothetical protein
MFPQRNPSKAAGAEAAKLHQTTSHRTRAAIQWVLKLSGALSQRSYAERFFPVFANVESYKEGFSEL